MILSKNFYQNDTITVAKKLLGTFLMHNSIDGLTVGRIVETEAYLGANDPASHTFKGETIRTKAMFGHPGQAYIYFTYGMYYCFNVVTQPKGVGEGVLIRALEPIEGLELMQKRRQLKPGKPYSMINLCNGPAKLVLAMGISNQLYGHDLRQEPLTIHNSFNNFLDNVQLEDVITTTRVGIRVGREFPLRFYLKDNAFVSKGKSIDKDIEII